LLLHEQPLRVHEKRRATDAISCLMWLMNCDFSMGNTMRSAAAHDTFNDHCNEMGFSAVYASARQ